MGMSGPQNKVYYVESSVGLVSWFWLINQNFASNIAHICILLTWKFWFSIFWYFYWTLQKHSNCFSCL